MDENNIRFLETPGASYQDMSFNFKVLACSKQIKLLEKPLLYYRQDNPGSSINNPGKVFCVCDEYNELTRFLNERDDLKPIFNSQKLINQYNAYFWNIRRLDESLQEMFLEKYSETFKEFNNLGEIDKQFFKSINKKNFELLLNKPNIFLEKVVKKNRFYWLKNLNKK